jgi:hypothetical protein
MTNHGRSLVSVDLSRMSAAITKVVLVKRYGLAVSARSSLPAPCPCRQVWCEQVCVSHYNCCTCPSRALWCATFKYGMPHSYTVYHCSGEEIRAGCQRSFLTACTMPTPCQHVWCEQLQLLYMLISSAVMRMCMPHPCIASSTWHHRISTVPGSEC